MSTPALPKIKLKLMPSVSDLGARKTSSKSSVASSPTKAAAEEAAKSALSGSSSSAATGIFAEYVLSLKAAKASQRRRSWRLHPATIKTHAAYDLLLPREWTSAIDIPKSRLGMDGSLLLGTEDNNVDITGTFVCTFEGCHRIFDAQSKWRRHQSWHLKLAK